MTDGPLYLTLPRIEAKPKAVELSVNYRKAVTLTPTAEQDLLRLIGLIGAGTPLPDRYYRRGVDTTPDLLLERTGFMHLHLAGRSSNELVYLVQFDDFVLLLETNTHAHFAGQPPGAVLTSLHHTALSRARVRALEHRAAKVRSFGALRASALR